MKLRSRFLRTMKVCIAIVYIIAYTCTTACLQVLQEEVVSQQKLYDIQLIDGQRTVASHIVLTCMHMTVDT